MKNPTPEEMIKLLEARILTIEQVMIWDMEDEEKWKRNNQRINNIKAEINDIKVENKIW